MPTFSFHTTPSIFCGPGAAQQLPRLVRERLGERVLLVTDPGIRRAGLLDGLLAGLDGEGVRATVFDEVEADPPERVVLAAAARAVAAQAQGVIGLGGGSSLDVAKLAAFLAAGGQELGEIYGVGKAVGRRLPLVQVPTTAGTGSEVTPIAIVTVGEGVKQGVVSPVLLPDVAVLDAELTVGLPAAVTAMTGIDAMVHAIEAYTSASANRNPISAALAREALRLLSANVARAVADGRDLTVRHDMLLGSLLAGQAFANSPVAAVHALAYPIGGFFHVPHGLSNALVLPHVLRFNEPTCGAAYAELATIAFPDLASADAAGRVAGFIARLGALAAELGLPCRLRDVGIDEDDLAMMAREAMKQTRLLVNNPRPVAEADALEIYRAAW